MEEIEIDIPDNILLILAMEAHKQDITLNQYINNILRKYMEEEKCLEEKTEK